MAKLPVPVGLGPMLLEFATAIGVSARELPRRSRSEIGAVAMKRAEVEVNFEMTNTASRKEGTVGAGIGVRSFLLAAGSTSDEVTSTARNRGRITMEIVAIADVPEPTPASAVIDREGPPLSGTPTKLDKDEERPDRNREPPPPDPPKIRAAIADALKQIDASRLEGGFEAATLSQAETSLARAAEALGRGDAQTANTLVADALKKVGR